MSVPPRPTSGGDECPDEGDFEFSFTARELGSFYEGSSVEMNTCMVEEYVPVAQPVVPIALPVPIAQPVVLISQPVVPVAVPPKIHEITCSVAAWGIAPGPCMDRGPGVGLERPFHAVAGESKIVFRMPLAITQTSFSSRKTWTPLNNSVGKSILRAPSVSGPLGVKPPQLSWYSPARGPHHIGPGARKHAVGAENVDRPNGNPNGNAPLNSEDVSWPVQNDTVGPPQVPVGPPQVPVGPTQVPVLGALRSGAVRPLGGAEPSQNQAKTSSARPLRSAPGGPLSGRLEVPLARAQRSAPAGPCSGPASRQHSESAAGILPRALVKTPPRPTVGILPPRKTPVGPELRPPLMARVRRSVGPSPRPPRKTPLGPGPRPTLKKPTARTVGPMSRPRQKTPVSPGPRPDAVSRPPKKIRVDSGVARGPPRNVPYTSASLPRPPRKSVDAPRVTPPARMPRSPRNSPVGPVPGPRPTDLLPLSRSRNDNCRQPTIGRPFAEKLLPIYMPQSENGDLISPRIRTYRIPTGANKRSRSPNGPVAAPHSVSHLPASLLSSIRKGPRRRPSNHNGQKPSNFCHFCHKQITNGFHKVCSNFSITACRKVICTTCFSSVTGGTLRKDDSWLCPHKCSTSGQVLCPRWSTCHR